LGCKAEHLPLLVPVLWQPIIVHQLAGVQLGRVLAREDFDGDVRRKPIQIELPDTSTVAGVTETVAAIIQATAAGQVTPAEASDLCRLLEAQRKAIELSEIEARLIRLESVQTR